MKILVALSGGIDSSVAAHLLAREGHELIGVRFLLWSDPLAPPLAQILPSKCCNAQSAARAASVAKTLGIPLHIVNLEEEFRQHVVEPFLEDYRKGLTPNPCTGCNRRIKFGKLLSLMQELGCNRLATGHYARIRRDATLWRLYTATDESKDQSYYLYGLSQEQLASVLFPLGSMQKSDVYKLAEEFGVPFEKSSYRESQDLCFFPEKSPAAFLRRHLTNDVHEGPIRDMDGRELGRHDGLPLYTIGQRRGLRIGGLKVPLEVIRKHAGSNTLVVAERGCTRTSEIALRELRFVAWTPPEDEDIAFDCRMRSLSPRLRGTLRHSKTEGVFHLESSCGPLAPGQSLVLYRGEEVVGGGVIAMFPPPTGEG